MSKVSFVFYTQSYLWERGISQPLPLLFTLSSRQSLTPSTASANTQRRPRSHRRRSSWSSCVGCSSTATRRRCHCPVCCLPPTSRLRHKQPPLPPHSPAATLLYPEDTLCLCHSLLHCQPVRLPQQWLPQVFSWSIVLPIRGDLSQRCCICKIWDIFSKLHQSKVQTGVYYEVFLPRILSPGPDLPLRHPTSRSILKLCRLVTITSSLGGCTAVQG